MEFEQVPQAFVWRGIRLERVIHRERAGSSSMFDMTGGRLIERPSDPPVFSGTVGMWRYSLERQSDSSWVGKISFGGATNTATPTYPNPMLALDFAAAWWVAAVDTLPSIEPSLATAASAEAG